MVFIYRNNYIVNKFESSNICHKWGNNNRPVKVLLLGTAGAGKTTIVKQMKILYDRKYLESERKEKTVEVRRTLHECLYEVLSYVQLLFQNLLELSDSKPQIYRLIENFLSEGENGPENFNSIYFENILQLWQYPEFKDCIASIKALQMIDGANYFLERLHIICDENYIPNDQDILQTRSHTTTNQKFEFRIKIPGCGKKIQLFWVYDVGGQRSERRKWIQVFSDVDVIIFVVACNEFDQTLKEDKNTNRLRESLKLFSEIWTSRFLLSASFILFLNKQDSLKNKVENDIKLGQYFPEFLTYNCQNADCFSSAQKFIRDQFLNITKTPRTIKILDSQSKTCSTKFKNSNQECYPHFTIATNMSHVKSTFNNVHSLILNKLINDNNLY